MAAPETQKPSTCSPGLHKKIEMRPDSVEIKELTSNNVAGDIATGTSLAGIL